MTTGNIFPTLGSSSSQTAAGGGVPNYWNSPTSQTTSSTIQLITTKHGKMLTEDKMNHTGILEVYNSYKSIRSSDVNVDFVKMIDNGIHDLISLDLMRTDWTRMTGDDFFRSLLAQYPTLRNTANSTLEERFHGLDPSLFTLDLHNPKCYNGLFLAVKKFFEVPDSACQ